MISLSCPSCGAALKFHSKASVFAVCSFCKSTLVRHDMDLSLLGKMSELQDDLTALQVGTTGFYQNRPFEIIGRLRVSYQSGFWNEWYCIFANGEEAWLAEAQGFLAVCFNADDAFVPEQNQIYPGAKLYIEDKEFTVDDIHDVVCNYSEGELPMNAAKGRRSTSVDLRGPESAMATIEYAENKVRIFAGSYQDFDNFKFKNLRESPEKLAAYGAALSSQSAQGAASSSLRGPTGAKPEARAFSCNNCGASVSLLCPGQSLTVVCQSCLATIDASDENYRIINRWQAAQDFKPKIELGSEGELFGKKWQVVGFMVREDKASKFQWEEYLLFNREQGYRWLTLNNGHFSFVRTLKDLPQVKHGLHEVAYYQDKKYRLFEHGRARVVFVLGEFYWFVSIDDTVELNDYINPPYMLSYELERNEMNWSLSEYIEAKTVKDAFKIKQKLPRRRGIAPNQPTHSTKVFRELRPYWIGFIVLFFVGQFFFNSLCSNTLVHEEFVSFSPNTKSAETKTSKVFQLDKAKANVQILVSAPVDNSWLYLSGELVNDETGASYDFERSVEYYHGYSDGESWSEGGKSDSLILAPVPAGKYYINYDWETGSFPSYPSESSFQISVYRDVPIWGAFFWNLFFVSIIPCLYWLFSHQDEVKRWSNSDYSPYASSED